MRALNLVARIILVAVYCAFLVLAALVVGILSIVEMIVNARD